uniref:Myb-like protein X n=1 Tax=Dermatophagoides pteronyssinus TaxID=6956 RepID=A0A6P6XYY7_DERPT|nr:myb-like protein X [Dermatophagoides pteronyssinus]
MLRTLNQEHVDIYRETIKTTDFPESGTMDQMEIYTKNFKDTRQRMRNELDKKLQLALAIPSYSSKDDKTITISSVLNKQQESLKNTTQGSKTTKDQSKKILRSDSKRNEKTQTPVSVIRRTQSTLKPKESQTNESLKEVSSQAKQQPITSSVVNEKQSTLKPENDQTTKFSTIHSQIEADSKNDPSFWDDFNKDSAKYYVQPTGVKAKAKKYFKRLWPFSKGNSEEQLKREELIRSEARRQYENIRKNRLELDKISTGHESSIEEIKDDPLLAKMLRTLNQEHVDIYRETIKTTDFPESGTMDQMEEWTKNFKNTREDSLKNLTHGGSQTTENQSTKIFRSNSYKDKKTQTPVSVIRRTQSKSKPTESQTEEVSSQAKQQPITSSVEDSLKNSTHGGSQTTENQSTKIFRSNSYKDKKTQTLVSVIRRTQSTSKPQESQTNENLKEAWHEFKKQQTPASVLSEQSSLSKPAVDRGDMIAASDSSQVEKQENLSFPSTSKPQESQTNENLKEVWSQFKKQSITSNVVTNIEQSTSKPTESQTTKILSSESLIEKNPENLSLIDEQQPEEKQTTGILKGSIEMVTATNISSRDSFKEEKAESQTEEQSILEPENDQATKSSSRYSFSFVGKKAENLSDEQSTLKPENDQATRISSRYSFSKKSSNGTKSANLSKQTIADDQSIQQPTNNHTSEPNIEITKSFNLDSSLTKRLQKSMKQTILSTATTQQMSGHQFLDYTKQF